MIKVMNGYIGTSRSEYYVYEDNVETVKILKKALRMAILDAMSNELKYVGKNKEDSVSKIEDLYIRLAKTRLVMEGIEENED